MSAYWHYLVEASVLLQIRCQKQIRCSNGVVFSQEHVADSDTFDVIKECINPADVEDLFYIKGAKNSESLKTDLIRFLDKIPTLKNLYSPDLHNYFLTKGMEILEEHSQIAFRLAILRVCLHFEYERTLFSLWFTIFESAQTDRDDENFVEFFICSLCHDLGLLDVNPMFTRLDHDPRSSKDDIGGYYTHVEYSASFLSRIKQVPSRVLASIEQHHENMDGTGYPNGKSGNQLAEFGQFIHLFDTLYSIYMKNYRPLDKTLADLVPIIEINAVTHFGQGALRLVELLRLAPRSMTVFFDKDNYEKIKQETDAMANFIEKAIGVIQTFTSSVGFRHEDKTLFVLQNSFIHIALAYYRLRILHQQAMVADALSDMGEYDKLAKALEDNFFTLREIIFHINKFLYRLRIYKNQELQAVVSEKVEEVVRDLSALTLKLVH